MKKKEKENGLEEWRRRRVDERYRERKEKNASFSFFCRGETTTITPRETETHREKEHQGGKSHFFDSVD